MILTHPHRMQTRSAITLSILAVALVAASAWYLSGRVSPAAPAAAPAPGTRSAAPEPASVLEAPADVSGTREPKPSPEAVVQSPALPKEPSKATTPPLIARPRALDEAQLSPAEFEKVLEKRYEGAQRDELKRIYESLREALETSGSLEVDDPNRPSWSELELLEREVGWLKVRAFS